MIAGGIYFILRDVGFRNPQVSFTDLWMVFFISEGSIKQISSSALDMVQFTQVHQYVSRAGI
jgi:hypothetical protein